MLKQITSSLRTSKIAALPSLRQRGQAMVEYAILLILLVMVVMGGAELGITAYHASKTGDGAKAAANEWANAVAFNNGVLLNDLALRSGETILDNDARHLDVINYLELNAVSITTPDCSINTPELDRVDFPLSLETCNIINDPTNQNESNLLSMLDTASGNPRNDFSVICTNSTISNIENCTADTNTEKFLIEKPILISKSGAIKQLLGNHGNPADFSHPNCDGAEYDNGLPDETNIYLFNPLPIDITNCDGSDGKKVSELIGGTNIYEGLPKLNQALYSQYTKVCVDDAAGVITIQRLDGCLANGYKLWLKPPGKMCGSGTASGTEYCPTEGDLKGATGFYFFGDSNDSGENLKYIPSSAGNEEFRPTFQLVCNGADYRDSGFDANGECNNLVTVGTGSFSLQVQTRYRSIFESFLTFGLQELPDDYLNLLPYFYNPNNVGVAGTNQLVGTAGSEIGPIGSNKNPTVKRFRDFRGCYQVDITPPDKIGDQVRATVSSCN
jgi:hypothetical protein